MARARTVPIFREYRLLIAAVSLSIFAEGMWTVVMALQVIALDDDPAALSLVATCLGVGLLAFILVGGIAADRIPRARHYHCRGSSELRCGARLFRLSAWPG